MLKGGLRPFVEDRMEKRYGPLWHGEVEKRFEVSKCPALDSYGSLKIMKRFWGEAFADLGRSAHADVCSTLSKRNQHAHDETFSRKEADATLVAMVRLLDAIGVRGKRAQEFAGKIEVLRNEMNVALPSQPSQAKPRTGRPTTSRPQMSSYLKNIVRKAEEKGGCEQRLFDSELREMLNEAKEAGQQAAQIVSKELCYRTIDEYVDGVMAMASEAMWKIWELQGSIPERVVYRSPKGFSNLLEIEFDTNNLPPNNGRA